MAFIEDAMHENDVTELTAEARSMLADGVQTAREKSAELGRRAATQIDSNRAAVACGLDGVAQSIRGSAGAVAQAGTTVGGMAHGAADTLASTARYVREHKADEMFAQIGNLVRAHPGKSLLAALALGCLAGRRLGRCLPTKGDANARHHENL